MPRGLPTVTVSVRLSPAEADVLAGEAKRAGTTRAAHAARVLVAGLAGSGLRTRDGAHEIGPVEQAVIDDFDDLEDGDSRLPMALALARTADQASAGGVGPIVVQALRELRMLRMNVAAETEEESRW